jgi:hypothetical protein
MEQPKMYTTQEIALELGVSDVYVRVMIQRGVAQPKQKIGRHMWLFDQAELDRLRTRPKRGRPKREKKGKKKDEQ